MHYYMDQWITKVEYIILCLSLGMESVQHFLNYRIYILERILQVNYLLMCINTRNRMEEETEFNSVLI
jgi:hypothetical protein